MNNNNELNNLLIEDHKRLRTILGASIILNLVSAGVLITYLVKLIKVINEVISGF